MNRRNLLLGLGTAATLSGAASVTGATFADSVTPTETDFRVIAQANVNVNGVANTDDGGVDNTTESFVDNGTADDADAGVNFTEIGTNDVDSLPVTHADGTTADENLTVTLAFAKDDTGILKPVLELDNTGDVSVDVGVYFTDENGDSGFGGDVDGSGGDLTPTDVVNTIQIVDSGDNPISTDTITDEDNPNEDNQTVAGTVNVPSGETENLGIQISDDSSFNTGVEAKASGNAFSGGVDDLDLIDAISIGDDPNTT